MEIKKKKQTKKKKQHKQHYFKYIWWTNSPNPIFYQQYVCIITSSKIAWPQAVQQSASFRNSINSRREKETNFYRFIIHPILNNINR